MTVWFLVAVMLWHDDGDMFNRRYSITPTATVMTECLPVFQGRKS